MEEKEIYSGAIFDVSKFNISTVQTFSLTEKEFLYKNFLSLLRKILVYLLDDENYFILSCFEYHISYSKRHDATTAQDFLMSTSIQMFTANEIF